MPDPILEAGLALIRSVQGLGTWLMVPMEAFTFLGQEQFYLFFMPALYWCLEPALGLRVGVIMLLSAGSNGVLKLIFHEPRPYWFSPLVRAFSHESSFGLPSGHAQNGVALWGLIGASLRRGWAWAGVLVMIVLIGVSRIYLAVHFPTDVYGGWLFGLLILVAFLALERPVGAWLKRGRLATRLAAVLVACLIPLFGAVLVLRGLAAWQLPTLWVENARLAFPAEDPINPLQVRDVVTAIAALFGLSAGSLIMQRQGGYSADGPWHQRALRFPIGLVGVVLIAMGLGAVLPDGTSTLAYSLRFGRYAFVGAWITYLAPLLFLRLGLALPVALRDR